MIYIRSELRVWTSRRRQYYIWCHIELEDKVELETSWTMKVYQNGIKIKDGQHAKHFKGSTTYGPGEIVGVDDQSELECRIEFTKWNIRRK